MEVSSIRHSLTAEPGNQNKPNLFHRIFPCITAASNNSLATPAENIYENIDINVGKSYKPAVNKTDSRKGKTKNGLHCLINMIYEIKNLVKPIENSINKISFPTFYIKLNEYGETSKNGNVIADNQDSPPQLPPGPRVGIIIPNEYAIVNDTLGQPIYAEPVGLPVINEEIYEEITFNNNESAHDVSGTTSKVNKGAESKSEVSAEKEPVGSFLYPKNTVDKKSNKPFLNLNNSIESLDIESILSQENVETTELWFIKMITNLAKS